MESTVFLGGSSKARSELILVLAAYRENEPYSHHYLQLEEHLHIKGQIYFLVLSISR